MFQVQGTIKYYETWVLAWISEDFGKYYRALSPRAWRLKPPMNASHVSIMRSFEGDDKDAWGVYEKHNSDNWKKYDGQSIIIDVIPGVQTDGTYYWLDCFSDEVGFVRRSLGLSTFRDVDHDYNIFNCYHITIGNNKCDVSKS